MKKVALFFLLILINGYLMAKNSTKTIFGFAEYVVLVDQYLVIDAKLDTGAKSASLNAINIKRKQLHGMSYIDFDVPSASGLIHFQTFFLGYVLIKPRSNEFRLSTIKKLISIKRPLVELTMQLGHTKRKIKVNLTNRKHFNYSLLLGRDAIVQFNGIVDPDVKYSIDKADLSLMSDAQ